MRSIGRTIDKHPKIGGKIDVHFLYGGERIHNKYQIPKEVCDSSPPPKVNRNNRLRIKNLCRSPSWLSLAVYMWKSHLFSLFVKERQGSLITRLSSPVDSVSHVRPPSRLSTNVGLLGGPWL